MDQRPLQSGLSRSKKSTEVSLEGTKKDGKGRRGRSKVERTCCLARCGGVDVPHSMRRRRHPPTCRSTHASSPEGLVKHKQRLVQHAKALQRWTAVGSFDAAVLRDSNGSNASGLHRPLLDTQLPLAPLTMSSMACSLAAGSSGSKLMSPALSVPSAWVITCSAAGMAKWDQACVLPETNACCSVAL